MSETWDERQARLAPLNAELDRLNGAVDAVVSSRKAWMDAHMPDYARHQVGEVIYDMKTGRELGTISRHYRYWSGRNPEYDTSMSVEYEYRTPGGSFDNTSRQRLSFGNAAELAQHFERQARLARMRWPAGGIDWRKTFAAETTKTTKDTPDA